jgi:TonB-dependent receptor
MRYNPDSGVLVSASIKTRPALTCGSSLLAIAALGLASPAMAQAADAPAAPTADEIVVTGFRASLQSAQKTKKNSDTIVDSVSADDIGALPDRSVTETLQRIPGISINRFAAGVDPDHFTAEGSGVVVRGLTYVRSEFNGRDAFTANNGRGLGFADVPSELLGGVDVFKSLPADHIEGGIAGTVDLKTRKPFDSNRSFISASIEINYGDFAEKSAPSGAIVASKRWDTSIGEIGILGSISYSQLFTRADRIALSHFKPIPLDANNRQIIPAGSATAARYGLIPSGAVQGSQDFNRERIGASAALQWRSTDGALEATFEFLRSDAKQTWGEHTLEVATDNVDGQGGAFALPGTNFTFDNSGIFTSGVITGDTGWRADSTNNGGSTRTPAFGLQSNNILRGHRESNVNDDYSANLKWKVTDRLTAVFDYQHVTSKVRVDDNTLWASSYQNAQIVNNGFNLPSVTLLPVQNCNPNCSINPTNGAYTGDATQTYFTGTHQSYLDPYNSFWRASMDHTERSDGYENAAKVDLRYDLGEDNFLNAVKVGYRYAKRDQTARFSTYNWGVLSEQWGNGGPVWLDRAVSQQAPGYAPYSFPNFFGGAVASPAGEGRLYFAGDPITQYAQYSAYALAINRAWSGGGGWVPLASRNGVIPGTPFLPGEVNSASERNHAGYIMATFGKDLGGDSRISGNVGVRYTRTERTAFGGAFVAQTSNNFGTRRAACAPVAGQPANTDAFCRLAPDIQAALVASDTGGSASYVPSTAKLTYDYFLPSANIKLELGNGIQFRAAYFKGIAPPDFGLTRNYSRIDSIQVGSSANVNGGNPYLTGSVTSGNPFLKPTDSDNFDLTGEYYFGDGGQFTVSLFYKELHNIVTNSTFTSTIPVGSTVAVINGYQPVNSTQTGKIKGFELSYQQNFTFLPGALSGLGLQANYTYVDSSGVTQSTLSSTDPNVAAGNVSNIPGEGFPLQGLSKHTFNIVPYYQKGPLTVRAAYSWRSQYLLTLRDVITPFDPIFQRDYGQLDGSITFKVNEHFSLGAEGVNLLNSIVGTSAAVYDRPATDPAKKIVLVPRQWYKTDRRFTISARLNF